MKHVNKLIEPAIITLREMYKNAPVHRMRQRAHIILMSNNGLTINEISLVTELDRDTISATINAWEKIGIIGLYDTSRSGRPPIFNELEQSLIASKINKEPRQLKVVAAEIESVTGKKSSIDTIKRIAKTKKLVWKRIKKFVPKKPDPVEYKIKKDNIEELKRKDKAGEIDLYFQDESGFSLTPSVPYAWQPRRENIKVPSSPSKRLNVLGFLKINQDWKFIVCNGRINSEYLIQSIEQLFSFTEKETWIIMDNSPIHKSKRFMEKIKMWAKKKLHILFLPTYSPESQQSPHF